MSRRVSTPPVTKPGSGVIVVMSALLVVGQRAGTAIDVGQDRDGPVAAGSYSLTPYGLSPRSYDGPLLVDLVRPGAAASGAAAAAAALRLSPLPRRSGMSAPSPALHKA